MLRLKLNHVCWDCNFNNLRKGGMSDITVTSHERLKSPGVRLIFQQANNDENIKFDITDPLWGQ